MGASVGSGGGIKMKAEVGGVTGLGVGRFFFDDFGLFFDGFGVFFDDFGLFFDGFGGGGGGPFFSVLA